MRPPTNIESRRVRPPAQANHPSDTENDRATQNLRVVLLAALPAARFGL